MKKVAIIEEVRNFIRRGGVGVKDFFIDDTGNP
jgi:hypothetical protein